MAKFGKKIDLYDSGTEVGKLFISSSFFVNYEEMREIPSNIFNGDKVNYSDMEVLKFKSKFEYNFLQKEYELYIKNDNINELQTPNFYEFVNDKTLDTGRYNKIEGTSFFEEPEKIVGPQSIKTTFISSSYQVTDGGPRQNISLEKFLTKFNPYKEQFPFYTDILFNTHYKTKFNISDIFYKRNLSSEIFSYCLNNLKTFNGLYNNEAYVFKYCEVDSNFIKNLINLSSKDLSLIIDLNNNLSSKQTGYTEVIGYRLQKYKGNPNTNSVNANLIQEWFFPNIKETTINWIDTQIKYDTEYKYKFSYIILTIAEDKQTNKQKLIFLFVDDEKIAITYNNKLLDSPPMEPEVEFIPFIDVNNMIKINMNTSTGKKTVTPIAIFNDDNIKINNLLKVQDSFDGKLFFQTDEITEKFEIYRLPFRPKAYYEFVQAEKKIINTYNASAASVNDEIVPNQKYYYIIRSVDYHQNFSNPTHIYEVELVNDSGVVYCNVNVIDIFNRKDNVQPFLPFKRFLKLKPSLGHLLIDPNLNLNSESSVMGIVDEKIWGKKFKIRLTSKTTGKKIDLNLSFDYTKLIK